jgi:hypothetical protein
MSIGEYGGDEVWCVAVHECEGGGLGVLLVCAVLIGAGGE